MKYHVHVSTFGPLPFWVLAPNGAVLATFKTQQRADRCAEILNEDTQRNTPEYWNKTLNIKFGE
jgi:hypothetical protein